MSYLMIDSGVDVHAWVRIRNGTSIKWAIDSDGVEFTLGGSHGFELLATTEGLRNLVREGIKALAQLDTVDKPIPDMTMAELLANQHDQDTTTSSGSPSRPQPPTEPHHKA